MEIEKLKSLDGMLDYPDPDVVGSGTTEQQFQEYLISVHKTLSLVAGLVLWQPKSDYKIGDRVQSPTIGSGKVAICTGQGKSGDNEPTWSGGIIRDGNVTWKIVSLFDKDEETTKKNLLLAVYPIGSIYMSTNLTNPATLFGGKWERKANGRVLQGADGSHAAGTTIEAGIPNITGNFRGNDYGAYNETYQSGAVTHHRDKYIYQHAPMNTNGKFDRFDDITLDASKQNAVYGKSDTVQPAAYVVYIWERVA